MVDTLVDDDTRTMGFRITGLDPAPFTPLFDLPDEALSARGAIPYVVDTVPGFPCRITLEDARPGERVLLLNYTHQAADTPYRASHAIFVRTGATTAYDASDVIPEALRIRLLSIRAFDRDDMMLDADVVPGDAASDAFERFLADTSVSYLQVHYAKRGCYAARVTR